MDIEQTLYRAKLYNSEHYVVGIYYKHLPYTPSPLDYNTINKSDFEHYLIMGGFSDWNMPRGIEARRIDITTIEKVTHKNNK